MFKKPLLFIALFLMSYRLEAFEIPQIFYIDTPGMYADRQIMNIREGEKDLGFIKRRIFGSIWSRRIPQYDLHTAENGCEAVAKVIATDQKYRVVFSIKDKNSQYLGKVEENWENVYFYYNPPFEIYSADAELLAIGQGTLKGGSFTLFDPLDKHAVISFVSKAMFPPHSWIAQVNDPEFLNRIDYRLLMLTLSISIDQSFHYRICGYKEPSASAKAFQEELEMYEDLFYDVEPAEENIIN